MENELDAVPRETRDRRVRKDERVGFKKIKGRFGRRASHLALDSKGLEKRGKVEGFSLRTIWKGDGFITER